MHFGLVVDSWWKHCPVRMINKRKKENAFKIPILQINLIIYAMTARMLFVQAVALFAEALFDAALMATIFLLFAVLEKFFAAILTGDFWT